MLGGGGALGAELVHEAEPDAERHDEGDDDGIGGIAGGTRHHRGAEEQDQQRVAQLAPEHPAGGDAPLGQHVRPDLSEAAARLGVVEPRRVRPECAEHGWQPQAGRRHQIERRHRRGRTRAHLTTG